MTETSHRFYYGWVIVAVSFFTIFFASSVRYCFGVFYVAILGEYGWGRAETAGAFSLAMVIHAFFSPVTGTLIDRFGPRTLFPLGAIFLSLGLAAASRISAIWDLYLFFGVVIAIGINTLAFGPHMSRIPKWFIRKRGLASGLVASALGLGTMALAPLIQFMIDNVGWRCAFLILGGIVLSVVVPMTALFQRRSPQEVGQYPDGIVPGPNGTASGLPERSHKDTQPPPVSEQWTLRTALGTQSFWWIVLVDFAFGFHVNLLVVHLVAHVVDVGYSRILAATLLGLVSLLASGGGIIGGFLSDRVGREIGYTMGSSAAFAGTLFFLFVRDITSVWMLYAFVILYGLGQGSTLSIFAATVGDLFSGNSLGRIVGIVAIAFGLGGALGAYVGGYFYDQMGSYTFPFLLVLASISVATIGIWTAAPRRR